MENENGKKNIDKKNYEVMNRRPFATTKSPVTDLPIFKKNTQKKNRSTSFGVEVANFAANFFRSDIFLRLVLTVLSEKRFSMVSGRISPVLSIISLYELSNSPSSNNFWHISIEIQ